MAGPAPASPGAERDHLLGRGHLGNGAHPAPPGLSAGVAGGAAPGADADADASASVARDARRVTRVRPDSRQSTAGSRQSAVDSRQSSVVGRGLTNDQRLVATNDLTTNDQRPSRGMDLAR